MNPRAGHGRRFRLAALVGTGVAAFSLGTAPAGTAQAPAFGLARDVVFQDYSPLSQDTELLRRMLSPLAEQAVEQALARSRKTLAAQSIDLPAERFAVYVPPRAPPGGYGLMVFIPPGPEAKLPAGWAPVLDQYGVIFVSAARSGNDADVLGRRVPLALLAMENLRRRYQIDPERIYIGGFSGGSRVALRMALNYPDVFRGAFLNAGSDPIGAPPNHLPEKALFARFQASSRIVYVTGAADGEVLYRDIDSLRSLRDHCVFGAEAQITPETDHEIAKPAALAKALASLRAYPVSDRGQQAACESGLEDDMARRLDHIEALIKAGKSGEAKSLLLRLDGQYGGLARERILGLAEACGCGILPGPDGR